MQNEANRQVDANRILHSFSYVGKIPPLSLILEVERMTTDQESHSMRCWSKATFNNLERPSTRAKTVREC